MKCEEKECGTSIVGDLAVRYRDHAFCSDRCKDRWIDKMVGKAEDLENGFITVPARKRTDVMTVANAWRTDSNETGHCYIQMFTGILSIEEQDAIAEKCGMKRAAPPPGPSNYVGHDEEGNSWSLWFDEVDVVELDAYVTDLRSWPSL